MKNLKTVKKENAAHAALIQDVISGIGGIDYVKDVNEHGIDAGFGDFIYYSDTCKFYKKHRDEINKMVFEMAGEFGEDAIKFVQSFRCVSEGEGQNILTCLGGGKLTEETTQIENALAWFAAETVCRMFEN